MSRLERFVSHRLDWAIAQLDERPAGLRARALRWWKLLLELGVPR